MTVKAEWITIGSHFADKMGYEDLVGATALVQEKRTAITQVAVMPHVASESFQVIDIHSEDVIREEPVKKPEHFVIINLTSNHIYYTTNPRLHGFLSNEMRFQRLVTLRNVRDMDAVFASQCDEYPDRQFFIHNLDAPADRHLISLQQAIKTRPSTLSIWPLSQ